MIYRAIWPITDQDRPASALIAEAAGSLDAMAARDGARITGIPTWTIAGERLVCEVDADRIAEHGQAAAPETRDDLIVRLGRLGWSVRQIAATTGAHRSTVARVLDAGGIRRVDESQATAREVYR